MKITPTRKFPYLAYHTTKSVLLALPDQYDNFDVFNNKSVRLLHPEAIKLEAIVHYCC